MYLDVASASIAVVAMLCALGLVYRLGRFVTDRECETLRGFCSQLIRNQADGRRRMAAIRTAVEALHRDPGTLERTQRELSQLLNGLLQDRETPEVKTDRMWRLDPPRG